MTQDEIIEMADKAGFFVKDKEAYSPSVQEDHELTPYLVAFAKLVAEKEQDGECKYCTHGCVACDARRQSNVLP